MILNDNVDEVTKWILILISWFQVVQAQTGSCILKDPTATINFGVSDNTEINTGNLYNYERVYNPCPTDGHYTYASYTRDCFHGDWITLNEDHTPGDKDGRMLLINSSYHRGQFFTTRVSGLKAGAPYEFSVWMMNVCRPSDKCPFPLLPNITIQVMSSAHKLVFELNTGNLPRSGEPIWNKFAIMFTVPKGENNLFITMINNSPGGCGNDFAVSDQN